MIWVLTMWAVGVTPFMAGEYQTKEKCEQAAANQRRHYRPVTRPYPLEWKCEPDTMGRYDLLFHPNGKQK